MVLYFKFLKFMCTLMLLFTILSIPSYIFFYYGNEATQEESSIKTVLSRLSLGNIGTCKCEFDSF